MPSTDAARRARGGSQRPTSASVDGPTHPTGGCYPRPMAARLAHTLIFAADHPRLAAFYAAVLGWPRTEPAEGFTIVGAPAAAARRSRCVRG